MSIMMLIIIMMGFILAVALFGGIVLVVMRIIEGRNKKDGDL